MNKRTAIRTDLGKAIRELREARGLTLDALAAKAGMHTTYLSRIERPVSEIATAAEAQAKKRAKTA
jgi:transcriptional regulator with XRE-family HTH domain